MIVTLAGQTVEKGGRAMRKAKHTTTFSTAHSVAQGASRWDEMNPQRHQSKMSERAFDRLVDKLSSARWQQPNGSRGPIPDVHQLSAQDGSFVDDAAVCDFRRAKRSHSVWGFWAQRVRAVQRA